MKDETGIAIGRRRLILSVLGIVLASEAMGSSKSFLGVLDAKQDDYLDNLLISIKGRDSLKSVGDYMLRDVSGGIEIEYLEYELAKLLTLDDIEKGYGQKFEAKIRKSISDSVREDFSVGRIVEVDGWVIAKTEAWLCMIAAIYDREDAV